MSRCIRAEFRRAFRNQMLWGALVIGCLFSTINILESVQRAKQLSELTMESLAAGMQINRNCTGFSLFVSWIALHPIGMGSNLFYFLLPILAAIPYGWSYSQDRKSGYYTQVITRMGKRNYFFAKYSAIYVSGGAAVSIPVLTDLLICALILPDRVMRVSNTLLPIFNYSLAGTLLYTHRWIYALLWIGLTFAFGGAFACMCFFTGSRLRLSALVPLLPFVITLGVDAILSALSELLGTNLFSIHYLPRPGTAVYNPQWAVVGVLAILIALTVAIGYWWVTQYELE